MLDAIKEVVGDGNDDGGVDPSSSVSPSTSPGGTVSTSPGGTVSTSPGGTVKRKAGGARYFGVTQSSIARFYRYVWSKEEKEVREVYY